MSEQYLRLPPVHCVKSYESHLYEWAKKKVEQRQWAIWVKKCIAEAYNQERADKSSLVVVFDSSDQS